MNSETEYTLVTWSDFARGGRVYSERLSNGESFVILKDSEPFAIVGPVDKNQVSVTLRTVTSQTEADQ